MFGPPLLFGPFFLQLLPLPLALQLLFPLLGVQFFRGAGVFPEAHGIRELVGKRYRTPIEVVVEFVLVLDVDHSLPVHDLIGESRHGGPPRGSGCVGDRPPPQMPGDRGSFTSETIDSLTQRIEFGFRRTYDRNQRGGWAGPFVGMLCRRQIRWTAAAVHAPAV